MGTRVSLQVIKTLFADSLIRLKNKSKPEDKEMPVIQVSVWEGMSPENKKKTVEGITKVFEDLGVPKEAVTIVIYEAPKSNWATGGQLHSERHANR
jgi:4-oxalocrotonate tautomerase